MLPSPELRRCPRSSCICRASVCGPPLAPCHAPCRLTADHCSSPPAHNTGPAPPAPPQLPVIAVHRILSCPAKERASRYRAADHALGQLCFGNAVIDVGDYDHESETLTYHGQYLDQAANALRQVKQSRLMDKNRVMRSWWMVIVSATSWSRSTLWLPMARRLCSMLPPIRPYATDCRMIALARLLQLAATGRAPLRRETVLLG